MTLTLPSFAKINWTLEILGKRPDGYHELRTLLQTISLADEMTFESLPGEIEIQCDHPDVPCDESNLAYRAARLVRDFAGVRNGVRITIEKRLPVAAGIGGGSGNAAMTLLAAQRLWGLQIAESDLFPMAASLGADVPFFLVGGTCVGVGRGDEVYPIADIRSERLLLVNAGVRVPTAEVYRNLPPELTKARPLDKMPLSFVAAHAALSQPDELPALHNDLEHTVFARHPLLAEIKGKFASAGAKRVLMSGSGSTVFGIFDNDEACFTARRDFERQGWWCEPARTLDRREYQKMIAGQKVVSERPERRAF